MAEYSEEEDEEEVEAEDNEEDSDLEDGQDVSEKGMQRLMAALGDDGLDEVDMAALDELAGDEDEDEDDDEDEEGDDEEDVEVDDEEEDDEEEEEEEEIDEDIPRVVPNANGDTLAASIARSGLAAAIESDEEEQEVEDDDDEEEDPEEAIAYEDLPDDIELSEQAKASRTQRIKVNNESALRRIYSDIRLDSPSSSSKLPWIETMRITYPTSISTEVSDVENDLERELPSTNKPSTPPSKVKDSSKLPEPPSPPQPITLPRWSRRTITWNAFVRNCSTKPRPLKPVKRRRSKRELKKFGKKVQVEKLQERIRNKKEMKRTDSGAQT